MTAADEARKAIAADMLTDFGGLAGAVAQKSFAAVMPDGRTVSQWLNTVPDLEAVRDAARSVVLAVDPGGSGDAYLDDLALAIEEADRG